MQNLVVSFFPPIFLYVCCFVLIYFPSVWKPYGMLHFEKEYIFLSPPESFLHVVTSLCMTVEYWNLNNE